MQGTIRLYRISLEKSEHKKMPFHILKELLNLNQLTFIERRKIKKKSANYQIFLHLFFKIIAFKTKLKHVINVLKENKSN